MAKIRVRVWVRVRDRIRLKRAYIHRGVHMQYCLRVKVRVRVRVRVTLRKHWQQRCAIASHNATTNSREPVIQIPVLYLLGDGVNLYLLVVPLCSCSSAYKLLQLLCNSTTCT